MPAFPAPVAAPSAIPSASPDQEILSVICAWPISGQYGPGSRYLYYVLVVGCVLGRGSPWLRGACLAAALLLPAVAALHGIVLATVHVDQAVDMDIYGAFQLCAIAVLAGPVTVRLSGTYFNAPGRNLIFLWTLIILAGLISLTVEFYRATPVPCPADLFNWSGNPPICNITCDVNNGPFSPLRTLSQNNIYVITNPTVFTFGAATLVCAACCIPPVLSLITMWNKILQQNWRKAFGKDNESEISERNVFETNAATPGAMVRFYLKMVEIPIFGAAIIAIVAVGEKNFWDYTVYYQTEPISSVGQWGPIVGTFIAALGSLYALLSAGESVNGSDTSQSGDHQCTCSHQHPLQMQDQQYMDPTSPGEMIERRTPEDLDIYTGPLSLSPQHTAESTTRSVISPMSPRHIRQTSTNTTKGMSRGSQDLSRTMTSATSSTKDKGSRHRVAKMLEQLGDKIGTPAPGAFDDTGFQRGLASDFPEVPGERERNAKLAKIKAAYDPERDEEGLATPLRRQRSYAGSVVSVSSAADDGGKSEPPSPSVEQPGTSEPQGIGKTQPRRATLQVPQPAFSPSLKQRRSTFSNSIAIPLGPASPTIKVSTPQDEAIDSDSDKNDNVKTPISPTIEVSPTKDTNHET